MDRENYCRLLGLNPLNEASWTQEKIDKRIDERSQKWANDSRNKQNDVQQRFRNERLVQDVDDIRRTMSDSLLRRREFENARQELKGACQKLRLDCVVLTDGTYIVLGGVAEQYAKKLHWDGVTAKDVVKMAGVYDRKPPETVATKVENAFKALRAVDAWTPTDMLNVLIRNQNLEISVPALSEGSSAAQIRSAFEACEKRVNSVRPDVLPDQDAYIQTMRNVKLVLDKDDELAKLIAYGRCRKALEPVEATIEQEYRTQLDRKYIDDLLNASLPRDVDRTMAMQSLQQFCYRKKIAANFSDSDSTMMRCPNCASMVQAGPNTAFCPICGKSFKQVCPRCGTSQQSTNARCIKCGFDFKEGTKKADAQALACRMDLQRGRVDKAQRTLASMEADYPGYSGLAALSNDIAKAKADIASARSYILDCYDNSRYAETKEAVENLIARYPGMLQDDIELAGRYSASVRRFNEAEAHCQKAKVSDTRQRRMEQYIAAVAVCPDHPVARAKLREDPPEGPSSLTATIEGRTINLEFDPPADTQGVTYCIYRSAGTLPAIGEDTEPLAEFPGTAYADRKAQPGVEYYYSVLSKRWGVLSTGRADLGPVFMLEEVSDVHIIPIAGGLRIKYSKPQGAARVRVWRARGENGTELAVNGRTTYDDIGLEGGVSYTYLFITEYAVGGRIERTEGYRIIGSAIDAPDPVKDLQIRWNRDDGSFSARWSTDLPVTLYMSEKKLKIDGRLQNMSDIESWMKRIPPKEEYSNGIRFDMKDGTVHYVYPVIQKGTIGVIGDLIRVVNLMPFRDVEYRIVGGDCVLTMGWPKGAVGARIGVVDPEAPDAAEKDAESVYVSAEQYAADRQVRIPMGRRRTMTLKAYPVYEIDGERINARGMSVDVHSGESSRVRYTLKKEKGGLVVSIDAGTARELPPIMMAMTAEGIPLKRTDGQTVWSSGGPVALQDGKTVVRVSAQSLKDVERCRLFFENDQSYHDFCFIHPLFKEGRR